MAVRFDKIFARSRIAAVCRIGAALSFLAFVVVLIVPSSEFLMMLAAWFLFWLFFFHWAFGAFRKLTVTHSRLIDYVYLGIAAIGVFVFALNYEGKRHEYLQLDALDETRDELEGSQRELAAELLDLEHAACRPTVVQLMPQYCERVKQLKLAFDAEDRSEANKDYSRTVAEYLKNVSPPDPADADRSQAYTPIELENQKLVVSQQKIRIELAIIVLRSLQSFDDVRDTTYGLFTWPFILAFAFALRITKTTIEVLDWTASKPTETTTPPPASSA